MKAEHSLSLACAIKERIQELNELYIGLQT